MSDNNKKDFEFIKEQVIEKKRKKFKKKVLPFLMTVCLAIIFGLIAAITFVITEPKLYELLHKEEETKTPAVYPTEFPEDTISEVEAEENEKEETQVLDNESSEGTEGEEVEPAPVIIEQPIEADIEDHSSIYDGLRKVSLEVERSLVTVVSINDETDVWFGTSVELVKETSGLVFFNDNYSLLILVSWDRIKDADTVRIKFSDSFAVDAVVQDYESEINLAMLAVPLENIPITYLSNLQAVELGESYTLTVGSPILALGSPNGHTGSMESGIISSRNSYAYITDNKLDLFNTDITDNENSDGVIVNMRGEVIGLITRTLKDEMNEELSTAIGISKLKSILGSMVSNEARNYFGVKTIDMPDAARQEYHVANGIYVNEVLEDSPAFQAGLQIGDIILQLNDNTIINTNNFYNFIGLYMAGEDVTVKVLRTTGTTQREMEIVVTLAEKEK
ncbi:MAG: hypothetical protein K0R46_2438 [Herbinix sp.]|jgi:S1-C subfamily serine protease|nr:hypothetical protein [Herbinix sp.]